MKDFLLRFEPLKTFSHKFPTNNVKLLHLSEQNQKNPEGEDENEPNNVSLFFTNIKRSFISFIG